jgi:magnesium chelatase subunit D
MNSAGRVPLSPWADAVDAATLFAIDPIGLSGVSLRAAPGALRERWLNVVRDFVAAPLRRLPLNVTDDRLIGGLDLAATLHAGRPVAERGILAEADGGILLVAMAERLSAATAGRLGAVLDQGEVAIERDGFALRVPARFGVIALDEGIADDERPPSALLDRLAFHVDLTQVSLRDIVEWCGDKETIAAARAMLPRVRVSEAILGALCSVAFALGIHSLRAGRFALCAARAAAALDGRDEVSDADAALAARLVLASRATQLPAEAPPEQQDAEPNEDDANAEPEHEPNEADARRTDNVPDEPLQDRVLDAARAAIPPGLLLALSAGQLKNKSSKAIGRAGAAQQGVGRGRPAGVRLGSPRSGARLNVVETLRAAAPWQPLRRRGSSKIGVHVRQDDFRINRFKQRSETTSIFVVDASGSAALHRLAEAKGAVELLLAECYVRRDRVALISFRGRTADILLAPTRSLVRAKHSLASLPGGGATPLAIGIDAATNLGDATRRRGQLPVIVFLTDGRANIARDGNAGRALAEEHALDAARRLRIAQLTALLVDTSPQPQPAAQRLADAMGARYLALPYADSAAISQAVRASATAPYLS